MKLKTLSLLDKLKVLDGKDVGASMRAVCAQLDIKSSFKSFYFGWELSFLDYDPQVGKLHKSTWPELLLFHPVGV